MSAKAKKTPTKSKKTPSGIHCCECDKLIPAKDQALFVEEEVGRYFCQESCIVSHFSGDIEAMEREYSRHVSPTDLSSDERERFAHLRWTTLEEPGEVWKEKLSTGDQRYTMISQFNQDGKNVWGVGVCLMLRGEPSFLFIAFVTSDRHLVDVFRKGEKQKIVRKNAIKEEQKMDSSSIITEKEEVIESQDGLAEPWTESDSVRASIVGSRKSNDIPPEDFGFYQKCLEETLQEPTELWSYTAKGSRRVYHFIREYEHDANYWYVVMAKDTVDDTQIEIIDAFPTKDKNLVNMCRHGKKEVLGNSQQAAEINAEPLKRTVH
jgi:hypothetical protein